MRFPLSLGTLVALFLVASAANAGDVSIQADNVSLSPDGRATFSGNVVVTMPTEGGDSSAPSFGTSGQRSLSIQGDIQFTFGKMVLKTKQAEIVKFGTKTELRTEEAVLSAV